MDALQPELGRAPPVEVVERVTHAARLGAPQLGIECLDLLQLCVQRGGLARKGDEGGMLRLEGGGDRCSWCAHGLGQCRRNNGGGARYGPCGVCCDCAAADESFRSIC